MGSTTREPGSSLAFDDEPVLVLLGQLPGGADHLVDQRRQRHRLRTKLELAGLDLRQVQHLVDQPEQVGAGAMHAGERFLRLLGAEARRVADHHLGEPDDGVERRAQLMAHAGEELRLVLAGQFELAALVLDLVEQAYILDRDHRLVGEGGHQLDLPVGERPHHGARQRQHADRDALAQQRNAEQRAERAELLASGQS